jgi:hypothetical protein
VPHGKVPGHRRARASRKVRRTRIEIEAPWDDRRQYRR